MFLPIIGAFSIIMASTGERGKMKRSIIGIVSVLFFLVSVVVATGEDITYNLVNYPADQIDQYTGQADTLSGSITTDGALGPLSGSDVTSWSFSVSGSQGTFGPYTNGDYSQIPNAPWGLVLFSGVQASSDQLILSNGEFAFDVPVNYVTSPSFEWLSPTGSPDGDNFYYNQVELVYGQKPWYTHPTYSAFGYPEISSVLWVQVTLP